MAERVRTVTGTEAKAADRYAIDVLGIPSLELMERASAHVADYIAAHYPCTRVVIACGTGNNGADGLCIGRMLKERGYDPTAVCCGNPLKGTWEYLRQLSDFIRTGGRTVPPEEAWAAFAGADVAVDALFGIGLKREVTGIYRNVIEAMNGSGCVRLSVDVPSGINADTGEAMGDAVRADRTFTFGRNKAGLAAGDGKAAAGIVAVCDIGIPEEAWEKALSGTV